MKKQLLISVSPYVQKYYLNETFKGLPQDIIDTLRAKLAVMAEKSQAIISLGFNEEANIYMEYKYEDLSYTDEIAMELRMKKFQQEEQELMKALKMWYMIYYTDNGKIIREIIILQKQGKDKEAIKEHIIKQFGASYSDFVKVVLEDE